MVGNMSFYKWPNFGAVMNRFSIKKKIKRKTSFFPAKKGLTTILTQALMGKMVFFKSIFPLHLNTLESPPWVHLIAKESFYQNHLHLFGRGRLFKSY
jgi:hypothetical protein